MADALKVLNFEGALGIQEALGLAEKLRHHIDGGNHIILNFSRVLSLDLSCLQVLLAAKKSCATKGLNLQLANQISSEALFALYTAGIIKHPAMGGKEVNRAMDDMVSGRL